MGETKRKMRRKIKETSGPGFTLLEVLAVVVIAGVITAAAAPNFKSSVDSARGKADAANILLLAGAVKQFRLDTGTFPANFGNLLTNPEGGIPGWDGPYLNRIPTSPSGRTYVLDPLTGRVSVQ